MLEKIAENIGISLKKMLYSIENTATSSTPFPLHAMREKNFSFEK